MIQICRAEDGEVFQVNVSVRDIERVGSLEAFLHQEIGVDHDAILAYLSDGRRIRSDNIRDLVAVQDQTIFVFNKYYLDFDLDEVLRELRVEAPCQPPIEDNIMATPPFRPSQLATSYLRTAHIHHDHVNHIFLTLHYQHEAIRIASSSLDLNVLAITDTFESIAVGARRELEKQAALLAGLEADLEIISRVRIHVEFMSPAVRKAIESGEKPRTLGDYVSNMKMKQVAETCSRTHDDLRARFVETETTVARLTEGTAIVRATVSKTNLLDESEACCRRSQEVFDKIVESVANLDSPSSDTDVLLQDLRHLDNLLRIELRSITDKKNAYTEQCIGALRRISVLNNDLVLLPSTLSGLQAGFRGKNSFSHIQRLHNMLYAYGATVVEIVRRKEFSRFFYQRAQSILEVMAKLSVSERKRRQAYRGEVYGQLPFDTRGMDDPVPTIDFSPSGNTEASYSLEREDVDGEIGLFRVLNELEQFARSTNDSLALTALGEARMALDKLVVKMDSLESGFDRIAERSLLSASRLSSSRRRSTEADEQAYQEVVDQLHEAQNAKVYQESLFQDERDELQAEIQRLRSSFHDLNVTVASERERADGLERDLAQIRAQFDGELTVRRIMEERQVELSSELENRRLALTKALVGAADEAKAAEASRQELVQVRAEFEDVKALEARNSAKIAGLLEDQVKTLRNLEEARARGEDLETQIQSARAESDEVNRALKEASKEKDRLLRAQASEHDRIIRDHIAEADGDRAVLEYQFSELKAALEVTERQLNDARVQNEVSSADAIGLREELQRVEHELREARHVERVLRDDLKAGRASQSDYEHRLENSCRLVAQILDVAIAFRNSHVKAFNSAQTMTSHPSKSPNLADSIFPPGMRHSIIGQPDEPSPIDPSDPPSALEALRAFDHDHFLEALGKTGSTIRKWQKQCKEYRERAKGKISFRNFAKGDLALFLPTRNSISKPWAAFNVSFPHYFLQATGHLAEQLKTREWIVARITSIAERVVDHKDLSSNPYGLGDGVKYYMLEVEDWTQPTQLNKRKAGSRKVSDRDIKEPVIPAPAPLTPDPSQVDVEDTFHVTRPPTSHLFPARSRSNSTPTAGPSSLSRLLAQAPPESSLETIVPTKTPSPMASPPPPPSPRLPYQPGIPSPLRPGSRASRSSSRFSVGRIPPLGSSLASSTGVVKAAPTTALSDPASGSSAEDSQPVPPSPEGSMSEALSNLAQHRRRTTSYHAPRVTAMPSQGIRVGDGVGLTASSTLASLASSWGVSFGRKRRLEHGTLATAVESPSDSSGSAERTTETSAKDLLKQF